MRNIYTILEFNVIREELTNYVKTEIGLERAKTLAIIQDKAKLQYELDILNEAMSCIQRYSSLPIRNSANLLQMMELASKGSILTPHDFNLICLDIATISDISKYFNKIKSQYVNLGNKVNDFHNLDFIKTKIDKIIANDLSIKDSASEELNKIRKSIRKLENEISSRINTEMMRYKEYLSDYSVTFRDDHYVLPVNSNYKNKVDGIILDVSDSGNTTFIEPSIIVSMSNDLYLFHKKENDEIKKILKELTLSLLEHKEEIVLNNKLLGYIDFVFAKAEYALNNKCNVAKLNNEGNLNLINAAHPLIDKNVVIKNTISLNKENRMLLISGPNAGGKTVSIKTLGLLAIMNQSGLALPVNENSTLPYFKNIFVDIGDSQSISDNLSTFSGHVKNLVYILENVKEGDLVLLDEIGTGTSPKEGEALAYAVIRTLLNSKCFSMISSHFEGLKAFALSNKHIQNASMIFDEKRLLPTYILSIGSIGKSYGLELAKRYHMNDDVLFLASNYLKGKEHDYLNEAISNLNLEQERIRNLKNKEKNNELELEKKIKETDAIKRQYDKKIKELEDNFNKEKEIMIKDLQKEIDEIIKTLSKSDVKLHEVINAKAKLKEKLELKEEESNIVDKEIKVGSYVEISDTNMIGVVKSISNNKVEITTTDGLTISTKLNKLVITDEPTKTIKKTYKEINIMKPLSSEVNVIGLHIDEAIPIIDRYLDDARMHHLKEVRLIHGMGSGRLRDAIHEYLKKQKFVEEYNYAPSNLGGSGATIVKLK